MKHFEKRSWYIPYKNIEHSPIEELLCIYFMCYIKKFEISLTKYVYEDYIGNNIWNQSGNVHRNYKRLFITFIPTINSYKCSNTFVKNYVMERVYEVEKIGNHCAKKWKCSCYRYDQVNPMTKFVK